MTTRQRRTERGFSLIELMVGVVIGLIAVLVIYEVFAAAEGIKRNTTSVGDAQQNGLMSSFMLGIELANAGNGVSTGAQSAIVAALVDCPGGVPVDLATPSGDDHRRRRSGHSRYVHGQLQRLERHDRAHAFLGRCGRR